MHIPQYVKDVLECMNNHGYEAYMVGGCVRDSVMGNEPNDYDITTNATPDETLECFDGWRVIPTGLQHGTVTVISEGNNIEITTYRIDGEYDDNRHPRQVQFTPDLTEDLARRDFTVNAMAMDVHGNICDPFNGMADVKDRIIRSVGDGEIRFGEDGLRIFRCIRFASVLGFDIEPDTASKVHKCRHLLNNISKERILTELKKLVCGKSSAKVCAEFGDVICEVVSGLSDVYDEDVIYGRLNRSCDNLYVRMALLMRDMGADLAVKALRNLKCDNETCDMVKLLISEGDISRDADRITVKKYLSRMDRERFDLLTYFASAVDVEDRAKLREMAEAVMTSDDCVRISQLAVNGRDMIALGAKGMQIGEILKKLLDCVMEETLPNSRDILIEKSKDMLNQLTDV